MGDDNKPELENDAQKRALLRPGADSRVLTAAEFRGLADVPPEVEWFANITNPNTRRAYQNDVRDFMLFAGIREPQEFRIVARSHLIAWRKLLESRNLAAATIRRKLSAVASLFDHLCESNAVTHNPCDGVKRPNLGSNEGKSPSLGDDQAKLLLEVPSEKTEKNCGIAPCFPCCSFTACAVLNCARWRSGISSRGVGFHISASKAKAERCALFPSTLGHWNASTITWRLPDTAKIQRARCSVP